MKRLLTLSIVALALLVASACHFSRGVRGSGVIKTEKRELAPFTSIETSGAFEVDVTCQKAVSVELQGDDNILPLIQTEVSHGVLHVRTTRGYSSGKVMLRISVPDLEGVKSTGAGKIQIVNLQNEKFEIDSTGAVTVSASGQSKSVKIGSTGAGEIDAHALKAERADVSVTGAASVEVNAREELEVSVAGAGRVVYSGNPKVNKHIMGAGQVTQREPTIN